MNIISWVNQLWIKWVDRSLLETIYLRGSVFKQFSICFLKVFHLTKPLFPLFHHSCTNTKDFVNTTGEIPLLQHVRVPPTILARCVQWRNPVVQLARCMQEAHYNKSYQFKKNNQNKVKNILYQSSITIVFNFFSVKINHP